MGSKWGSKRGELIVYGPTKLEIKEITGGMDIKIFGNVVPEEVGEEVGEKIGEKITENQRKKNKIHEEIFPMADGVDKNLNKAYIYNVHCIAQYILCLCNRI